MLAKTRRDVPDLLLVVPGVHIEVREDSFSFSDLTNANLDE